MRCLYCGKELALLKRWTRGGQFCSEAHKKSYQEEYNRIGLSRLLQAQSKPKASQQEAAPGVGGGSKAPSRPDLAAPVAVEDEPVEVIEEAQPIESAATEAPQEAVESVAEAAGGAVDEKIAEEPAETAWEPDNMAGFINNSTPEPVALEVSPYSAPWKTGEIPPVAPLWQSQGVLNRHLPEAAVLELKFRPNLAESEHSAPEVKLTPNQFEPGKPFPPTHESVLMSTNQLPSAGVLKLDMTASTAEWSAIAPTDNILSFPYEDPQREWTLLQLRCTDIELPGAEAPVVFEGESADGALWQTAKDTVGIAQPEEAEPAHAEALDAAIEPEAEAAEIAGEPVAATEGLAELSEGLTEEQPRGDSQKSAPEAEPEHEPLSLAEEPLAEEPVAEIPHDTQAAPVTPAPRSADQAVDIPLKIFTPAKPSPVEGAGALIKLPVFLPGHTGLPLRPKMGLVAAGSGAGSKKSSQRPPVAQPTPENKAAEAKPGTKQEPKTAAAEKMATETAKTEASAKPATPAAANTKPWGKPTAPPSPKEAGAKGGKSVAPKVQPAPSVKITPPAAKPREEDKPKTLPAAEKIAAEKVEKAVEPPSAPKPKPAPVAVEAAGAPVEIEAPSFGAQGGNTSFLSTLKGKLAIGGVAAVLCLGAYFIFGGKSPAPAPNQAAAADKAGPSIMVGGGGWVEGWSGDPNGAHFGRQITIYRPSLKLSDYRIEFKGEIEHKSLGWVFRATDPENYYAMKLAITTPGLEPKISLVKSVVSEGKETQAGKTPINLDVRLDTQYSVRVDVRGIQVHNLCARPAGGHLE